MGQKLWAKQTFWVLEFSEMFGPEVDAVDPRGTSGWTSLTFHQHMDPERQAVLKLLILQ